MSKIYKFVRAVLLVALWAGLLSNFAANPQAGMDAGSAQVLSALAQELPPQSVYLPLVYWDDPLVTPFGLETQSSFLNATTFSYTQELQAGSVRMGVRISWRLLQPVEGGPIYWDLLANVDRELRLLNAADIDAVMVITDSPLWAVVVSEDDKGICNFCTANDPCLQPCSIDEDGDNSGDGRSYCGAIRADMFDDFAAFMRQLVLRYNTPEYNVKIWEIGNEIDVDPNYVPGDSGYGCWGDDKIANFNGGYYGKMLKVVTPAIKAVDPGLQVWIGGLLLSSPYSAPSYFLKGILVEGAAPYFDAVPYHWYAWYDPNDDSPNTRLDYDTLDPAWDNWGGGAYGKAKYLREILVSYKVGAKPLVMNEVALGCKAEWAPGSCYLDADGHPVLSSGFLQAQADFIPRAAMRALKGAVQQVDWFMLEENYWGFVGLLDYNRNPKPVYYAYQNLIEQYDEGVFLGQVYYDDTSTEAYAVRRKDGLRMHVVWKKIDGIATIKVPEAELIAIYSRDGAEIDKPASVVNGNYSISVGFSPIYLILKP